jgi:hypothetical protein
VAQIPPTAEIKTFGKITAPNPFPASRLGRAACCTDRSRLRQVVIFGLL